MYIDDDPNKNLSDGEPAGSGGATGATGTTPATGAVGNTDTVKGTNATGASGTTGTTGTANTGAGTDAARGANGSATGTDGANAGPDRAINAAGPKTTGGVFVLPKYQGSEYDKKLRETVDARNALNYDKYLQSDSYRDLADSYQKEGEKAMQNTLGQLSARTGGLASSYAATAAQQTYSGYMAKLQDVARQMYNAEKSEANSDVDLLMRLSEMDKQAFRESLSMFTTEWERNYELELQKAAHISETGDFSGYENLGYSAEDIEALTQQYKDDHTEPEETPEEEPEDIIYENGNGDKLFFDNGAASLLVLADMEVNSNAGYAAYVPFIEMANKRAEERRANGEAVEDPIHEAEDATMVLVEAAHWVDGGNKAKALAGINEAVQIGLTDKVYAEEIEKILGLK